MTLQRRDVYVQSTSVTVVQTASEVHLGEVGGATVIVSATPTCSTAVYAAGDLVGGKIELASAARVAGGSGVIQSVTIVDDADQGAEFDVVFFEADPTTTTFTDNAAFDPKDADLQNSPGFVTVSDYASFNDNSIGTKGNAGLAFVLDTATSLYAALVTRGAPTYAATDDVTLRVAILQD